MAKLIINELDKKGSIAPEIYGHFAEHLGRCIYEGVYVGADSPIPNVNGMRTDVVEALKALNIPVLRWPGGCFADEYHWKDGIGPKESRKKMINTHWGGVLEDNRFGTHEYMELCRQLGCKTYINGNVGSGTVQEMSEWVEYMTFDGVSPMADLRKENGQEAPWTVDFFGVGNENWGCGGNMTPAFYANLYRQYQTYIRNYNAEKPILKVCGGPNVDDYNWTEQVLSTCFDHTQPQFHGFMDYLSLHYYVFPHEWGRKGSATDFTTEEWYITLRKALYMDTLLTRHSAIMDQYDPDKLIGLAVDEWGNWFDVEPGTNPGFLYQQNTVRDALVAGITLNIFNKHCDRVRMANIAQMINVLQSVILTEGDRMLKTPTYHIFHMYRHHQGGTLLQSSLTGLSDLDVSDLPGTGEKAPKTLPRVTESVSQKDGIITVTLSHLCHDQSQALEIRLSEKTSFRLLSADLVTGALCQHNSFDRPEEVTQQPFTDYRLQEGSLHVTLPPASVVCLRIR